MVALCPLHNYCLLCKVKNISIAHFEDYMTIHQNYDVAYQIYYHSVDSHLNCQLKSKTNTVTVDPNIQYDNDIHTPIHVHFCFFHIL